MKQLFIALKARYDGATGKTLRDLLSDTEGTPKYHLIKAPKGTKLPVLIASSPASGSVKGSMSASGVSQIEDMAIQFTIFIEEYQLDAAMTILDELRKLYDNYRYDFGTGAAQGHCVTMKRVTHGVIVPDPDGGYDINVDYLYSFVEVL